MNNKLRQSAQKLPAPHEERSDESSDEAQAPPELAFTLDHYLADCFVDVALMIMEGACVARGTFRDAQGREVLVHVPTLSFFNLHTMDPNASHIWDSLCLAKYFALPAWGPDLRRAWEALSTLGPDFKCRVTNFAGEQTDNPAHSAIGTRGFAFANGGCRIQR